jgi:DNA-3-methyladenine glycosylase II
VGSALRDRSKTQLLVDHATPEEALSARDSILGRVIASQKSRWPSRPIEDPIWGLVRIVMAQQISTQVACRLAERVRSAYPLLTAPSPGTVPEAMSLRALGLSERRARCCITVLQRSEEIRANVRHGQPWEGVLTGIKGIGPWTLAVFRIMVLRDPDVLPLGDVGLERAIANVYGRPRSVARLGETWRPFRSVACWYLWRTLGNEQLG